MGAYDDRRQEILDGKRSWGKNEDAGGDADVFYTEYVLPLRELRDAEMFERLWEHRGSYRGTKVIDRVDILGAVNLDG